MPCKLLTNSVILTRFRHHQPTFEQMNLSDELIHWYHTNKRDLPWRNTVNAYVIWLSEIILQQTRVEQGLPYFYRFLEKYPDVISFAAAGEDDILKLWQGLGYYSRGRNMLKTAQQVIKLYNGIFPVKYEELIKLKGIGEYTAAAISSFSANEARAVVDGNVFRVLARYYGISEPINSTKGKKLFQTIADDVLNKQHPSTHNQAIMEFGAMLCKPKNPDCGVCPIREGCMAFKNNQIAILPQKLKKLTIRTRFLNYLLFTDGNTLLMSKRADNDIWANMYDLPLIETSTQTTPSEIIALDEVTAFFGENIRTTRSFPIKKHILTHQHLYVQFIQIDATPIKLKSNWFYTAITNLNNLALPKVVNSFLTEVLSMV